MRLGTTYNGRTVRLYARPLGTFVGAPGLLVATGRVNSKGYFVATPKVNGRTTFTAYFGGDYRYEPASRSVTVLSTSLITTGLSGYSGIDRGVRLYRNGTDPVLVIKVAPSQTGACVSITAQILVQQRYWRSAAASACSRLGPGSVAIVRFVSARTIGATYRFRASVKAGPNGSGATSGWAYARFSL
jgi:hypothetical protein